MIDIKMTINGRPLTPENIQGEFEKAIFGQLQAHIQEQLRDVPSELNGEKLIVELEGSDLDNLSMRLTGPTELIEQAKNALGAG